MQTFQKARIILESPVLYAQLDIKGSILDKALTKIQVDAESRNGRLTSKIYSYFYKINILRKAGYIKFSFSEKATKISEIFLLLWTFT